MYCVNCGNKLDPKWKTCPFCASPVSTNTQNNASDFDIVAGVLMGYHGSSVDVVVPDGVIEIAGGKTSASYVAGRGFLPQYNKGPFEGLAPLRSIKLPSSVTHIGASAFRGCQSLISINIPDGVSAIENETFFGCSSLTQISLPVGVTKIGKRAFQGCSVLQSVSMPSNLHIIDELAFNECHSLKNIMLPNHLDVIGPGAFTNCTSLTSLVIPNTVTRLGGVHEDTWKRLYQSICYGCPNLVVNAPSRFDRRLYSISGNNSEPTALSRSFAATRRIEDFGNAIGTIFEWGVGLICIGIIWAIISALF